MIYSKRQRFNSLKEEYERLLVSSFFKYLKKWIKDIINLDLEDNSNIKESGSILPTQLFEDVSHNIPLLCKQINASYENKSLRLHSCYDATSLLVLAYQNHDIESDIQKRAVGSLHSTK